MHVYFTLFIFFDIYLNPLFRPQKKILRCIKFHPSTAPSAPLFCSLKILKLEDMLHLNILSFVYRAINKLSPISFHNYFTPDCYVYRYGTRPATRVDIFILLKRTSLYGLKMYNILALSYGIPFHST